MTETYTFSRALHLMRYGGKKMKPELEHDVYFCVKNNKLYLSSALGHTREVKDDDWGNLIYTSDIMGSWIEVKDA